MVGAVLNELDTTLGIIALVLSIASFAAGTVFKAAVDYLIGKREKGEDRKHQELQSVQVLLREQLLGMRNRRVATVDEKRIEALLKVWEYAVDAGPLHLLAKFSESANLESLVDAASKGNEEARRVQAFADGIWRMSGLDGYKTDPKIDNARVLVPGIVWATFSAYQTALLHPVAWWAAARTGLEKQLLRDSAPAVEMVRAVLPQFEQGLTKHGPSFLSFLVESLKEKLLEEIARALDDPTTEERETERAKMIMAAVTKFARLSQEERVLSSTTSPMK